MATQSAPTGARLCAQWSVATPAPPQALLALPRCVAMESSLSAKHATTPTLCQEMDAVVTVV